jgi:hypothetical protein
MKIQIFLTYRTSKKAGENERKITYRKKMKLNFALPPMTSKAFSPNACNGPALS